MPMNYWLAKSEPGAYSWADLSKDQQTAWTGVRNYEARNNLRAMKRGDLVFFYHSGEAREVVGTATVVKEAYADPTAKEGDWACVDLKAGAALGRPVTLAAIKVDKVLRELPMVKKSRISVTPVGGAQARRLLEFGELSRA
jgi:predicted RNA-binding protein with PUA-like domain